MFQESKYSEEQSMIAAYTAKLAKEYDHLYFLECARANQFPTKFWQQLSEDGYLGMIVSEDCGGAGFNTEDLVVFIHNMAKGGLASYQLINQILCSDILARFASDEQKQQYLPKLISGERWSYACMEQSQGRSLYDFSLGAKKDGDNYLLNGQKSYVVCAGETTHFIISARTKDFDENNPESGISLFAVDAKTPGIEITPNHINVRISEEREEVSIGGDTFFTVTFNDVSIPASCLIGKEGYAGGQIKQISSRLMLMIALMTTGWADRLLDKAVAYANERTIYKDPIGSYQAVQHPMVLAKTDVEMSKLLIERAVEAVADDEGQDDLLTYCSVAKYYASDAAHNSINIAIQAHGGSGFDRDTGIIGFSPLISIARAFPLNGAVILESFAENVLLNPSSNIVFEKRTDMDRELLIAVKDYQEAASKSESPAGELMKLMPEIMTGKLSKFKEMILNDGGGALPVKSDLLRQYTIYGNADPTEGVGIPEAMNKAKPVKFLLTAMALTAISTGKDGLNVIMTKYLPQLMQGKLFCYAITEPGAGTNTNNVSTIAVDEGDHYRLNGQKTFISAADSAHYMVVIARLEVDGEKQSVGTFVMETKTKGISMTALDIAALGDQQFTIHYDDVILPKEALVGAKSATGGGAGLSESVLYTLNLERIGASLGGVKIATESFEKALKKAGEKPAFGPAPKESKATQQALSKLGIKIALTNLALKKATTAFDLKEDSKRVGMYANMSKYLSSVGAYEAGELALGIYGIEGLNQDCTDVGALHYLARLMCGIPINNEMVLNFLGENLLGLPKSYQT